MLAVVTVELMNFLVAVPLWFFGLKAFLFRRSVSRLTCTRYQKSESFSTHVMAFQLLFLCPGTLASCPNSNFRRALAPLSYHLFAF